MKQIWEFKGEHSFLSNFFEVEFIMDGEVCLSGEHAFQAAKTLDFKEREHILLSTTPGISKRRGRSVELRSDWECIKVPIMAKVLHTKFKLPEMERKLISTGDALLVEGNAWGDAFWGFDLKRGFGQNMLGRLLMMLRKSKRNESYAERYKKIADSNWFKKIYEGHSLGEIIDIE